MYAGHFAAAVAIKAAVPKTPSWALFVGVTLLDLLWAPFMVFGLEVWDRQTVQIGWSHSFAMALLWSVFFAAMFARKGWAVCAALATAVFSHFALDLTVHKPHLPLYPYSSMQFGFNLGQTGWSPGWWFELGVIVLCCSY